MGGEKDKTRLGKAHGAVSVPTPEAPHCAYKVVFVLVRVKLLPGAYTVPVPSADVFQPVKSLPPEVRPVALATVKVVPTSPCCALGADPDPPAVPKFEL